MRRGTKGRTGNKKVRKEIRKQRKRGPKEEAQNKSAEGRNEAMWQKKQVGALKFTPKDTQFINTVHSFTEIKPEIQEIRTFYVETDAG